MIIFSILETSVSSRLYTLPFYQVDTGDSRSLNVWEGIDTTCFLTFEDILGPIEQFLAFAVLISNVKTEGMSYEFKSSHPTGLRCTHFS